LAIDPLDENYILSAGPQGDPAVSLWDQRFMSRSSPITPGDTGSAGPVLEFKPAVDNAGAASTIWSLRFSGNKRGRFGVLSNTGEFKVIDTAQHFIKQPSLPTQYPTNSNGGSIWSMPYYTKMSHTMEYPWYDKHRGRNEDERIAGFDFIQYGMSTMEQTAVAIRPSREVEMLTVPTKAPQVKFSVRGQYAFDGDRFIANEAEPRRKTAAEEMTRIQNRYLEPERRLSRQGSADDRTVSKFSGLRIDDGTELKSPKTVGVDTGPKSVDRLLRGSDVKLSIRDTLNVLDVHRRRCFEGYRLDPERNKTIVSNEKGLVEMWDTIQRLEELVKEDGMVANDVDLSYLGVADIWQNTVDPTPGVRILTNLTLTESTIINAVKGVVRSREYPAFEGVSTQQPEHRQLCLAVCGWTSSGQTLLEESNRLFSKGEYYKAIALAVFKGHKRIALELLKHATNASLLSNIGLGAVIACDSVNPEQRDLCSWMAESATDPYLQALLQYFVSGDWSTVTSMSTICVSDRLGIALKHLPDSSLTSFLQKLLSTAVTAGDISALALTGLSSSSIDLFQSYISRTDDLQTAVLAASISCPLYVSDPRYPLWRATYASQLQAWRAFAQRAHFFAHHNRRSVRDGKCLNPVPKPRVRLHCLHCQQPLARNDTNSTRSSKNHDSGHHSKRRSGPPDPGSGPGANSNLKRDPGAAAGTSCPKCGRPMPRCAVCMLYLGTPDPRSAGGAKVLAEDADKTARLVQWCMNCRHAFHGHHAREWFKKHQICPVPDCGCTCGIRDGPGKISAGR
jgi:WD repeat-containing protein mio